ncbi:tautomerase family protein [Streptomyces liangshanensis]|uniref:tautomerase family protein n=1 Tax=Streptomyces liangshanensis TaxID=2717324 RepID=UPI0036DF6926
MPLVTVSVAAGRDPATLRACLTAVHEAVRDALGVPDASVRVLLTEVPAALWSAGGVTLEERARAGGGEPGGPVRGEGPGAGGT